MNLPPLEPRLLKHFTVQSPLVAEFRTGQLQFQCLFKLSSRFSRFSQVGANSCKSQLEIDTDLPVFLVLFCKAAVRPNFRLEPLHQCICLGKPTRTIH